MRRQTVKRKITSEDIDTEIAGDKVRFTLSKDAFQDIERVANVFGGELDVLVEDTLHEDEPVSMRSVAASSKRGDVTTSIKDLEAGGTVVAIDKKVLKTITEAIDVGLEAKDWYTSMNKTALEILGESDGCLFLILLAIFSPKQKLEGNLRLASQVFCGIKKDLENPESHALLDKLLSLSSSEALVRIKSGEFSELKCVQGAVTGALFINVFLKNFLNVLKLYKSKNWVFSKSDVIREVAKHLSVTHTIKSDSFISAEKVLSFTLNLLDPSFKYHDTGWMPVTIDTWMVAFFYPHMTKAEQEKSLASKSTYMYLAKITQQLAKKHNMAPHEMQAIIWTASIRKKQGPNYTVAFQSAVEKNLKKMKYKEEEIKEISKFFDKTVLAIGCRMF